MIYIIKRGLARSKTNGKKKNKKKNNGLLFFYGDMDERRVSSSAPSDARARGAKKINSKKPFTKLVGRPALRRSRGFLVSPGLVKKRRVRRRIINDDDDDEVFYYYYYYLINKTTFFNFENIELKWVLLLSGSVTAVASCPRYKILILCKFVFVPAR